MILLKDRIPRANDGLITGRGGRVRMACERGSDSVTSRADTLSRLISLGQAFFVDRQQCQVSLSAISTSLFPLKIIRGIIYIFFAVIREVEGRRMAGVGSLIIPNSSTARIDSHSITICLKDKTFSPLVCSRENENPLFAVCGTREKEKIQSQRNYKVVGVVGGEGINRGGAELVGKRINLG